MTKSQFPVLIAALLTAGCAAQTKSDNGYLSENAVIDLMNHPKQWDGKTVTVKIFPYDNGFTESYLVCFEACDEKYAESSPFIIYTRRDRFKGYNGEKPIIVKARYSSTCFYRSIVTCVDFRAGQFTELP
jgi:hypothetical protein